MGASSAALPVARAVPETRVTAGSALAQPRGYQLLEYALKQRSVTDDGFDLPAPGQAVVVASLLDRGAEIINQLFPAGQA
jgi:hypothetical protein